MRKRGVEERRVRPCEFLRVGILKMGQREFADLIGLSQSMISTFEGPPIAKEKFPFHALQAARRHALANGIAWPKGFTDRLLDEDLILMR